MGRWSLLVRIGALIAIAVFVVQLVLVAAIFANRNRDTGGGFRYPLPDQIVAIVEMAETSTDRGLLLRALNSSDFSVSIERGDFDDLTEEPIRVPRIERVLNRYHEGVGGRRLVAFVAIESEAEPTAKWLDEGIWTNHPLRMVIELTTGELLIVESRGGKLSEKVFSWPLGLFSGTISVVVALVVLLAVRRETQPLRRLGSAALHFARTGEQRLMPEHGAPEIKRLTTDFNSMQVRISELLSARSLMLGALGHDLRTYLTRIQLRVDSLGHTEVGSAIDRDLNQMNQLVDDSLMLARLGVQGRCTAEVDTSKLLKEMVDEYAATGADIQFIDTLAKVPVRALIPEGLLRRLATNLIDNALKYGTRCRVSLNEADADVSITIEDDGPGVPEEDLGKLSQPFYRANAARTLTNDGHGLGLAIAKEIATQHGGSITLNNSPGGFVCLVTIRKA